MVNTDKSLLEAHCKGDRTAFAELLRRYGGSLLGYLVHMTGSREQAEDLFQETFKRVHQKAHTFRGGAFKSWLFTIATRLAIDASRRRAHRQTVSLSRRLGCTDGHCAELAEKLPGQARNPSEEAILAEQKQQVRQAIDELPGRQRATLVLAYYQQLNYSEVARVMGCSTGTVKAQMSRALRTLARKLPDVSGVNR